MSSSSTATAIMTTNAIDTNSKKRSNAAGTENPPQKKSKALPKNDTSSNDTNSQENNKQQQAATAAAAAATLDETSRLDDKQNRRESLSAVGQGLYTQAGSPCNNNQQDGNNDGHHDFNDIRALTKFASLLSVPLPIIFRQVSPSQSIDPSGEENQVSNRHNHKTLLNRNEAQCLLTLTALALDLDSLITQSNDILQQQQDLGTLMTRITPPGQGIPPFFSSLWAVCNIMQKNLSWAALERVNDSMNGIIEQLPEISIQLRQSSELNWTIYESFAQDDAAEDVAATEKRHLAELQEELARRVEALLEARGAAHSEDDDDEDASEVGKIHSKSAVAETSGSQKMEMGQLLSSTPMMQFCSRLFDEDIAAACSRIPNTKKPIAQSCASPPSYTGNPTSTTPPMMRASSSQNSQQSNSQQSATKVTFFPKTPQDELGQTSRPASEEKENTPFGRLYIESGTAASSLHLLANAGRTLSPTMGRSTDTQTAAEALVSHMPFQQGTEDLDTETEEEGTQQQGFDYGSAADV